MNTNIIPKFCCLLIISFLMLVLFYYLNKYNETYENLVELSPLKDDMLTEIYNTPLECEDHLKIQVLSGRVKNNQLQYFTPTQKYELNKSTREFCEKKCKPTNCIYKEFVEKVPDIINTLNIKTNAENNLVLSWLSPHSEHPILKYICVIESESKTNPLRVEVPIINNNDIVEHIITGLDENTVYTLKLFSENKYGLSQPKIKYNLNIKEIKELKEEEIPSNKNSLKDALNSLLLKNKENINFKINLDKIEEKYSVKKKIILNYLLEQYKKLNNWKDKKTIKII